MKKLLQHTCLSLIILVSLDSCNVTRNYIKRTEKQYTKLGTVKWIDEMDSVNIHWRKVGEGDVKLLFLHGFGPMAELQWKDVVKELHDDFTIFIPDLIYFGLSTSEFKTYDPGFIARQLYKSLEKEEIETLYIAGVSYGGLISTIIAHEHPESVKGLILIDALSKFLNNNHTDSLARAHGYNSINDILIPTNGKSLKTLFQISFYKPNKYPSWLLNGPAKVLYSNQTEEKRGLLEFLSENEENIKKMNLTYMGKVHIVWGEEDVLIPVSNAYKLEKIYPNAFLTILPEVGHVANMENPKEVAKIIKEFAL